MFNFLKQKALKKTNENRPVNSPTSFLSCLKTSLKKTRQQLTIGLAHLVLGEKKLDPTSIEKIEDLLLSSDVGPSVTESIIDELTLKLKRKELSDDRVVWQSLQQKLINLLQVCEKPWYIDPRYKPYVILVVGVNGVGKTTNIGKLAYYFKKQGKQVMLAAGDTFRAAATEQLAIWADRNQVPLIAQHQGADSASVIYDAFQAARARNMDVLIADTAGRLHTKINLMQELQKIKKVMGKLDAMAPHEIMLILDASTGQNALVQADVFHEALQLTSLMLTKLDGTAKGGTIFAIAEKLKLPIRFVGLGEGIDDLCLFSASEFISALFDTEN